MRSSAFMPISRDCDVYVRVLRSPAVPQLLAQDELLNLARRRPGQLVDGTKVFGPLLAGEAGVAKMSLDLVEGGGRAAGAEPDHRAGVLAEPVIRCGDHGDLGDRRQAGQQLLDFGRADVLPAPNDDVLPPIG